MNRSAASIRVTAPLGGVSHTTLYEALDADGAPIPGPRVALVARTHGNEPVGDGVLERLSACVDEYLACGSILTVVNNYLARDLGRRHSAEGSDLNRLWDADALAAIAKKEPAKRTFEEQRAHEIAPLLIGSDAVLDLHSTSQPSAPFLLYRDDQRHGMIARNLGVDLLITGIHENTMLEGGLCSNVGLFPGERSARLGFTFEAGQHSNPGNAARAWGVAVRLMAQLGIWAEALPASAHGNNRIEVYDVIDRFRQAPAGTEPYRFVGYAGGEPGGGRSGPPRLLHSFEAIEADEIVLRRGDNQVVRAQSPFTLLMPAPKTDPGTDLFFTAQPRHGGLTDGVARSDADACSQAKAIERMLDLLGDDDFARGTTTVGFDSRRLLDQCASEIARTMRLPVGDPQRRVTIVGRGTSGDDEVERRAGRLYREAMRRAIANGVPIERIQLLRGASLGWLDAMTNQTVRDLTARRGERTSDHEFRLRLSLRQPHTVSILAVGDIEAALAGGDTRHARVAVLIEAATVEPDGESAAVNVVRTGVISARRDVMLAAWRCVRALRAEHENLVTAGRLRGDPGVVPLLLDDGAIGPKPDPAALDALRGSLYRLQLQTWADALRTEVPIGLRLGRGDIGPWLAATMASTGILDAGGLRSLLVRRDGDGWIVDPERLHRIADGDEPVPPAQALAAPARRAPMPPFEAAEVTADTLERWVGWKRFVRGGEGILGTHGKDIELAYTETAIRGRFTRWFRDARLAGARQPGRVMVVVSGDGLNPAMERISAAWDFMTAHRDLVGDSHVAYLRIQHAQGTHLAWMKDLMLALERRGPGAPVAMQWEGQHGATVNMVLVLSRADADDAEPWSLDGWEIDRCGIVMADLEGAGSREVKVAMFTERSEEGSVNQELLHFGRSHCEGLLHQSGWRIRGERGAPAPGEFDRCVAVQIGKWIERARGWGPPPPDVGPTGAWVARRLGLVDEALAAAIALEIGRDGSVSRAAERIWSAVSPWPGDLWSRWGNVPPNDGPVAG